ncbi:MAG: aldehyde dehydrogenase family protein [Candidatus Latescibacterota bacterium]|jgi:acyl-CoA reductase-like NAD-dependent aldehyde dehydrogenase
MSIKKSNLLIGGEICPSESGQYYPLHSPVDGALVAEVADATAADVDRAVAAAREAFYSEWKFCGIERKRALFAKLKEALYAMADDLSAAKVQPPGGAGIPPLVERVIDYYVSKLDDGAGQLIEHGDQGTNYVYKEPLGVVAIFVPFNGPMLGALLSAIPALVAGNTIVVKAPDQEAPQALKVMQAFHDAGFPAGVVNAISGKGPEVGQALVAHPATRLISFTGSTATGKKIMAAAAADLKRVQLNLGSKTAQIVFPDADLEAAVQATVGSSFPGQACSAISRILVHSSVRDEFLTLLKEKAQAAGPSMLIDATAIERIERYVEMGNAQGELLFGGSRPTGDEYAKGCYFEPTVFAFADQSSSVCRDEIFGPVVSVLTFDDDDEALALANDTDYGLLVSLWTQEAARQRYCVRRLEMGIVTVNSGSALSHRTPWGGFKQSGIGRRYGEVGLEPFFEYKTVWIS